MSEPDRRDARGDASASEPAATENPPMSPRSSSVSPELDRFAVCPTQGPVLPFYRGVFESVFVLLHPFIRPLTLSAEALRNTDRPWRETLQLSCEAVRWSEVQRLAGLASLAEVDIALRTQIGALTQAAANLSLTQQLREAIDRAGLVEPIEGGFDALTHNSVLSFIQAQGHDWVWVGDEFGTERKLHGIEGLTPTTSTATEGRRNVFTPDHSLLWTAHWDSHFAFFCGPKAVTARLAADPRFEGFECGEATQVYWSLA